MNNINKYYEKINELKTCIICFDNIEFEDQIQFENCIHGEFVHYLCIKNWNNTCPICRAPIHNQQNNLISIIYYIIINLLEIIFNQYYNGIDVNNYLIINR
jgi:hypothetical protein